MKSVLKSVVCVPFAWLTLLVILLFSIWGWMQLPEIILKGKEQTCVRLDECYNLYKVKIVGDHKVLLLGKDTIKILLENSGRLKEEEVVYVRKSK